MESLSFEQCKSIVICEMAKLSPESRRKQFDMMYEEACRLNHLNSLGKMDGVFHSKGNSNALPSNASNETDSSCQSKLENKLEKLIEDIQVVLPHLSFEQVIHELKEIKQSNNGTLSGLTLDNIVDTIAEHHSQKEKLEMFEQAGVEICPCCLDEIEQEDVSGVPIVTLPECKHVFHKKCISRWFAVSKVCPTCRCPQEFPPL